MREEALTLHDINSLVRRSIEQCMPDEYWVQAETSDVRSNNGHCYLEFVQKDPRSNQLIAKARGVIWAKTYHMLRMYFEESTGQSFTSGIKVLVKVSIQFHELFGFSLVVNDIDPTYTLGDLARRRIEIVKQLEADGVLTLNKELEIPALPQRIAVISSATAAGYGDFSHQLANNAHGYAFYTELFPAIMQGVQVEDSILKALDRINDRIDEFDVVVIIRGGGAASDLSGFDTYLLAAACAQYSLPIITGIGHERDDTVLDMVAHTRVKTPTAAAELLIGYMDVAAERLAMLSQRIKEGVGNRINNEFYKLESLRTRMPNLIFKRMATEKMQLKLIQKDLTQSIRNCLSKEKHQLQMIKQRLYDISPERILAKGYSITLMNGKPVTNVNDVEVGDELTTLVKEGKLTSIVKQKS